MLKRHWFLLAAIAVLAVPILFASRGLSAADTGRGRTLYEARCMECHEPSVHTRTRREARDFAAVRAWVARWSASLALGWGAEEIDDVAAYLNSTYYRFQCPTGTCAERS